MKELVVVFGAIKAENEAAFQQRGVWVSI